MCLWGSDTKSFGHGEVRRWGYLGNVFRMWVRGAGPQPWPQTSPPPCKTSKQRQTLGVSAEPLGVQRSATTFSFWEEIQKFFEQMIKIKIKKKVKNQSGCMKAIIHTWRQTHDDRWASSKMKKIKNSTTWWKQTLRDIPQEGNAVIKVTAHRNSG